MDSLQRYWFSFKNVPAFSVFQLGCGITAYDKADAERILNDWLISESKTLEIASVMENVDVQTLDAGHILPNMGNVMVRGIWFPRGLEIMNGIDY